MSQRSWIGLGGSQTAHTPGHHPHQGGAAGFLFFFFLLPSFLPSPSDWVLLLLLSSSVRWACSSWNKKSSVMSIVLKIYYRCQPEILYRKLQKLGSGSVVADNPKTLINALYSRDVLSSLAFSMLDNFTMDLKNGNEYERERERNIARNKQLLDSLQIPEAAAALADAVSTDQHLCRESWKEAAPPSRRRHSSRSAASSAREKMKLLHDGALQGGDGEPSWAAEARFFALL